MRQRKPFKRLVNKRNANLFVIATEGRKTEPTYFKELAKFYENPKIQVEVLDKISNNSSPKDVLKLLDEFKKAYKLRKDDELWLVIDRDVQSWDAVQIAEIAKLCNQKNYYLALTNPCFEFWLLLHIVYLCNYSGQDKTVFFENKKINKQKRQLEKSLSDLLGGYSKSNLNADSFLPFVKMAIQQAKSLDLNPKERWPEKKLGSRVYLLVEKLIT